LKLTGLNYCDEEVEPEIEELLLEDVLLAASYDSINASSTLVFR